jgi:hypothetical protein
MQMQLAPPPHALYPASHARPQPCIVVTTAPQPTCARIRDSRDWYGNVQSYTMNQTLRLPFHARRFAPRLLAANTV